MIGIEHQRDLFTHGMGTDDIGVGPDRIDVVALVDEPSLAQQAGVPVRGPALVHDLAGKYRIEVKGLLADGEEDVPLPLVQVGGAGRDEPQEVALRARGQRRTSSGFRHGFRGLAGQILKAAPEVAGRRRRAFADERGIRFPDDAAKGVDVGFQRQGSVEDLLDPLPAVLLDRGGDPSRVLRRLVHETVADLLLAAPEQRVVLREVGMTEHVRDDQRVLRHVVATSQVGASRLPGNTTSKRRECPIRC